MHGFTHMVVDFEGHGAIRRFAEAPSLCPVCGHHTDPWRLAAHSTEPSDRLVDFAFQCRRDECRRVFVGSYQAGPDGEMDLLRTEFGAVDWRIEGSEPIRV